MTKKIISTKKKQGVAMSTAAVTPKRTFRHWESLWAYTFMADMCLEYADYGCDGTGD